MENQQSKTEKILEIIMMVIILGAIGVVIYAWYNQLIGLAIAAVGFGFFAGSIPIIIAVSMKEKRFVMMPVVFTFSGAALLIIGLLIEYGSSDVRNFFEDYFVALIGLSVAIAGLITLAAMFKVWRSHKTNCTTEVSAECVELLESIDDSGDMVYCPVWEFWHNGEARRVHKSVYIKSARLPHVGDKKVLMVDAERYDDYFEGKPFDTTCKVLLWIGLGLFATGTIVAIIFFIVASL